MHTNLKNVLLKISSIALVIKTYAMIVILVRVLA